MNTTTNKFLNAIINIKNDLKDKINAKGGSITDTTPFAEYPSIADELMGSGGEKVRSIKLYLDYTKTCARMFYNYPDSALPEGMLEYDDTSEVETMADMFAGATMLEYISPLNTSKLKRLDYTFYNCKKLKAIQLSDTSQCFNFQSTFTNCLELETVHLNLVSATSVSYVSGIFANCKALTNLTIENIKIPLQIGYASSYGHLLTLDSLLNTIKELIDTGSSNTLTIGSANLDKIANVYVKLTGEAEEDESNPKLPFVVCESTDEGAMLITDYVTLKNWSIAA